MTNEKSQVAVKLTAEDINKYFSKDDWAIAEFLKDFKAKGLTINDFKFKIIREDDNISIISLMDSNGNEHECTISKLFLDNHEKILTDLFPLSVFIGLLEKNLENLKSLFKS